MANSGDNVSTLRKDPTIQDAKTPLGLILGPLKKAPTIQDGAISHGKLFESILAPFIAANKKRDSVYKLYDFIFPKGKIAVMAKIEKHSEYNDDYLNETLKSFKFVDPLPVIVLSGAHTKNDHGKLLAGLCRAAFRTDAVIMSHGLKSGIEHFALRKNVNLVACFPEKVVELPKMNISGDYPENTIINGHTH